MNCIELFRRARPVCGIAVFCAIWPGQAVAAEAAKVTEAAKATEVVKAADAVIEMAKATESAKVVEAAKAAEAAKATGAATGAANAVESTNAAEAVRETKAARETRALRESRAARDSRAARAGKAAEATEAVKPPIAESSWPESDTVLDLLRADAEAAAGGKRLDRAQEWLAASPSAPPYQAASVSRTEPSGDARDRLDVLAIYGVGQSLYADIAINGELWRYRQGRRWPQGIDDSTNEPRYSLVRIEQPCVRLRWQETQRTACLRGGDSKND